MKAMTYTTSISGGRSSGGQGSDFPIQPATKYFKKKKTAFINEYGLHVLIKDRVTYFLRGVRDKKLLTPFIPTSCEYL